MEILDQRGKPVGDDKLRDFLLFKIGAEHIGLDPRHIRCIRSLKRFVEKRLSIEWKDFVDSILVLKKVIDQITPSSYWGLFDILHLIGLEDKDIADKRVSDLSHRFENVQRELWVLREEVEKLKLRLSERERENKRLKKEIEKTKEWAERWINEYFHLKDEYEKYRKEVEPIKDIPVLCIACMMRYWDPKIGCRREYYTGVECDLRFYCERLARLIDWNWGKRPKGETIKKFLERFMCRFCQYRKL
ncbi:MAG: hypothetical protein DRJ51_07145 [Thermoprotei archaeon]|nr:MAG: hypothetical protein DRJ51_07145 [Thermoprotei archaeon]